MRLGIDVVYIVEVGMGEGNGTRLVVWQPRRRRVEPNTGDGDELLIVVDAGSDGVPVINHANDISSW